MTITNNKSIFLNVKVRLGNKVIIERLAPGETRSMPHITDAKQVVQGHIVKAGHIKVS